MTYNITGRYGGFFRVLRYNVGGYGILANSKPIFWLRGYGRMPYPPTEVSKLTSQHLNTSTPQHLNTYLLAAWVWQDAIPSYISFKTQHLNTSTSQHLNII